MPMCTRLGDWIWNTEQGFHLVESGLHLYPGTGSFSSFPSDSIEKHPHMTYCLMWGRGKQARITRSHSTCWAVCVSSWSAKSTSGGGEACQSELNGGGRASGGRSRHEQYVKTHWIVGEHGVARVRHLLPWCRHCGAFYIGCDPAGGVASQEGHNLQVRSLDSRTNNRHVAWDDVGCNTQGNLRAMLLKPVSNAWSCHLASEHHNTCSRRWDIVQTWEAGVPPRVPCWAPLGLCATAHPSVSKGYCASWSESAGEWPLWCCALRASGGSSKIDCQ